MSVMASSRGLGVALFAEIDAALAGECFGESLAVGFGADFLVKAFLTVDFFATVFFELGDVALEEVFFTVVFLGEVGVFLLAVVFRLVAVFLATGFVDFAVALFLLAFFLEGEALAAVFLFVLAGALRVLVLVVDMCGMNFGRG